MQQSDKQYKRKPHFKIKDGDLVGSNNILLIKRTYLDDKEKWHGDFLCPYCQRSFDAKINNVSSGKTTHCGCIEHKNRAQSKIKPMIGKKFDKLTVIAQLPEYTKCVRYLCLCDCGNFIVCNGDNLRNGDRTSCGCKKREPRNDLSGQRFGKLTVKKLSNERTSWGTLQWDCVCDCGTKVRVNTHNLISGNTTSCGCIKSKGELKIQQILQNSDIAFVKECVFEECINPETGCYLRFDFYIPQYNLCIEYDGQQHFIAHGFITEKQVAETQKRDKIKNIFCAKNNIPLIRISYLDYDNLSFSFIANRAREIGVIIDDYLL